MSAAGEGFVLALGRALHEAGAPSHRVEDAMAVLAPRLGIAGQFFTTPTSIFASFGPPDGGRTALLRVEPAGVNLARLAELDALLEDLDHDRIALPAAEARLAAIVAAPVRYGLVATVVCSGLASATVACFFGGGWREVGAGAAIGLVIGVLAEVAARRAAFARVFEWIAAPLAAVASLFAARALGPMVPLIAALAGLIALIPGLTFTVALTELASKHLVSGTARLAGAGLSFVAIGLGLALGARLAPRLGVESLVSPALPLPPGSELVALALTPIALTVLFRARPRDAGVIALGGTIAFVVARLGGRAFGVEVGMLAAALAVGLFGNAYARVFRRPAAVPIVPSLLILVPGSLGVKSIASFLAKDVVSGLELAFSLFALATALAAGLLLANLFLPPRRSL
jgi:uncharacterized membrane protein YjjP (DUF1212 family)